MSKSPERTRHIHVPPSKQISEPVGAGEERTVRIEVGAAVAPAEASEPSKPAKHTSLYDLYAIQSKIGDGGMGVVYLAKDRRLERYVAIKRLNQESQGRASLRQRFLQEARAVAALNHIFIVHIYALGEDDEGPYIVMEFVEGPASATHSRELDGLAAQEALPGAPLSLERQVIDEGQYTVNEAIELIVKISKAIAYAHANGVIHRDLKPSNILIDTSGEPKIVDFGLARQMFADEHKLTSPGEKLLSLGYGAPEQEHDASLADHRADIYGLGALLYFAITGKNPRYFREQDIPLSLREVLGKALATDREQRWASVPDLLEALQSILTRTRVEQPTTKTTWRCKWCDTVNPLTIRFCSECGWDGSESCPECGSERFVGVQFCGSCGADARVYESIIALAQRMQLALKATEYERVVSLASRAQGFEPVGPSGRSLAKSIQDLAKQATASIARRDQLKTLIPMEIRAENYERAERFIKEFRTLSGNQQLYSDELAEMPAQLVKRDLKHACRACNDGEWAYAIKLCDNLLDKVAPDNPDCLAMRRMILRRRAVRRSLVAGGAAVAVMGAYLAALPLVVRGAKEPPSRGLYHLMRPAYSLYTAPATKRLLAPLAKMSGPRDLAEFFAPLNKEVDAQGEFNKRVPAEMRSLAKIYKEQLRELDSDLSSYEKSWPAQYLQELDALMERRRNAGDYEAWKQINDERLQFARNRMIGELATGEHRGLAALKSKYQSQSDGARVEHARHVVAATKKHLNELATLQSGYTKEDKMEEAASVDDEIRRVRAAPAYAEAEATVAEQGYYADSKKPVVPPPEERIAELLPLRQAYDDGIAAIEGEYSLQHELWPERYQQALEKLMIEYQTAGDFASWDAVRDEMERFEIDRQLLVENLLPEPQRLLETQQRYLKLLRSYGIVRAQSIVDLAEKQLNELMSLQSEYTKKGEMEYAGAINTEMRRLRGASEVVTAHAELDEEYSLDIAAQELEGTKETTGAPRSD